MRLKAYKTNRPQVNDSAQEFAVVLTNEILHIKDTAYIYGYCFTPDQDNRNAYTYAHGALFTLDELQERVTIDITMDRELLTLNCGRSIIGSIIDEGSAIA